MHDLVHLQKVDYLVVGHCSIDLSAEGPRLGGTAAYAALTARALGLRPGIVTALKPGTDLAPLAGIPVVSIPSEHNTTFENISEPGGRRQVLHGQASPISLENIPDVWRSSAIVHLAPVAAEIDAGLASALQASLLGITPQGWMRLWDDHGRVRPAPWTGADEVLPRAGAVVMSMEDVDRDLELVEAMAQKTRVLCLTEAAAGAVVYWHGDRRRFRAPEVDELDSTGAGDIFAAVFFARLLSTRDPWEAARLATLLASRSVTRAGLASVPTPAEIEECLVEVLS